MPFEFREFKDLDLDFTPHPISGDVNILKGIDAVKRAVRNLILYDFYERPFNSRLGSGVKQHLFENLDRLTVYLLRANIETVLSRFEPRIDILDIILITDEDNNRVEVEITFALANTLEPVTINLFLKRVR